MPRKIFRAPAFLRTYCRLSTPQQQLVDAALKKFEAYLATKQAPAGLGAKHVGGRTYEFRAGLALRIVYVIERDTIVLALLGSHDEVRRFLRRQ